MPGSNKVIPIHRPPSRANSVDSKPQGTQPQRKSPVPGYRLAQYIADRYMLHGEPIQAIAQRCGIGNNAAIALLTGELKRREVESFHRGYTAGRRDGILPTPPTAQRKAA